MLIHWFYLGYIISLFTPHNQKGTQVTRKHITVITLLSVALVLFTIGQTQAEEIIVWKQDVSKMVLIPAGTFEMGNHFHTRSLSHHSKNDEIPVHKVKLDAFYMDIHEVTVGQFKRFVNSSGYTMTPGFILAGSWAGLTKRSPTDEHPMANLTWGDADAYVGGRLA